MTEVTKLIESRQASTYSRRDGDIIETIDGDLGWRDLSDLEQRAILEFNVTWQGFTPEQELDVIGNVLARDSPEDWMNGVLVKHQAKKFDAMRELEAMFRDIAEPSDLKSLAAEIRSDEHAARVRDFGPEDTATYEARMAEAHRQLEHEPVPAEPQPMSNAELGRVVADLEASWAAQAPAPRGNGADDYDRLLTLAAARQPANDNDRGRDR